MELPPLQRRSGLLAAGCTDEELRRRVRTGDLSPIRPGTYLLGAPRRTTPDCGTPQPPRPDLADFAPVAATLRRRFRPR